MDSSTVTLTLTLFDWCSPQVSFTFSASAPQFGGRFGSQGFSYTLSYTPSNLAYDVAAFNGIVDPIRPAAALISFPALTSFASGARANLTFQYNSCRSSFALGDAFAVWATRSLAYLPPSDPSGGTRISVHPTGNFASGQLLGSYWNVTVGGADAQDLRGVVGEFTSGIVQAFLNHLLVAPADGRTAVTFVATHYELYSGALYPACEASFVLPVVTTFKANATEVAAPLNTAFPVPLNMSVSLPSLSGVHRVSWTMPYSFLVDDVRGATIAGPPTVSLSLRSGAPPPAFTFTVSFVPSSSGFLSFINLILTVPAAAPPAHGFRQEPRVDLVLPFARLGSISTAARAYEVTAWPAETPQSRMTASFTLPARPTPSTLLGMVERWEVIEGLLPDGSVRERSMLSFTLTIAAPASLQTNTAVVVCVQGANLTRSAFTNPFAVAPTTLSLARLAGQIIPAGFPRSDCAVMRVVFVPLTTGPAVPLPTGFPGDGPTAVPSNTFVSMNVTLQLPYLPLTNASGTQVNVSAYVYDWADMELRSEGPSLARLPFLPPMTAIEPGPARLLYGAVEALDGLYARGLGQSVQVSFDVDFPLMLGDAIEFTVHAGLGAVMTASRRDRACP